MISTNRISLESKILTSAPSFFSKGSQAGTIPKSKRFHTQILTVTPGPGTYNMYSETVEKSPETPGPGSYSIPKLASGPKFSISNRAVSKSPISPGPGHYETPCTNRPKSVIFSKSLRKINFANGETPGPGHYTNSSSKQFSVTCTFPRAPMERTKSFLSNLGPGCYEILKKERFRLAISKERRKSPFEVQH